MNIRASRGLHESFTFVEYFPFRPCGGPPPNLKSEGRILKRNSRSGAPTGVALAFALAFSTLAFSSALAATDLQAEWKDGLHVFAEDKSVDISLGGFFQNDWTFQRANDALDAAFPDAFVDGTEFRRTRLVMKGFFHESSEFQLAYEFAKGDAGLKDVYLGLRGLPGIGNVRVGHFKEPFGFEQLISDTYSMFLERPLENAFAPSRNTGVMVHDSRDRATWAVGAFRDADSFGNGSGDGRYNVTGRLTFLPWDAAGDHRYVHLGAAASLRNPVGDAVEFSARPETNLAPKLVSTGMLDATDAVLFGGEGAIVVGPTSLSGEVSRASVETGDQLDPAFWGAHATAGWFLTGESRAYNRKTGVFDRMRPNRNFKGEGGGPGAWELAARWSRLDLETDDVGGGVLEDFTFAVNWYLNPNVRVLSNYVHGDLQDVGDADLFSVRFQTDF